MKVIPIEVKPFQSQNALIKLKPYLKDIINDFQSDKQKNQLTIAIYFDSSNNTDEEHVMHSKSDNIKIMIKADEVIRKFFKNFS